MRNRRECRGGYVRARPHIPFMRGHSCCGGKYTGCQTEVFIDMKASYGSLNGVGLGDAKGCILSVHLGTEAVGW